MRARKGSKAIKIRAAFEELGWDARPREIIKRLSQEGIEVTAQQVSNQKAMHAKPGRGINLQDLPVSVLKKVKELVDQLGSVEAVRRALDDLAQLR